MVLIDAIVIKVRDTQVANRPFYVAIGVNLDGERHVLGMCLGPTGDEGAKQWTTVLTELRDRGPNDVLIVCRDGEQVLPYATRVTLLRTIYTPPTVNAATGEVEGFAEQWRNKYPAMIVSWERTWDEFVPFLAFPIELRKIVYTTNAIKSLNTRFRRVVAHRGHSPTSKQRWKPSTWSRSDDRGAERTSPAASSAGSRFSTPSPSTTVTPSTPPTNDQHNRLHKESDRPAR